MEKALIFSAPSGSGKTTIVRWLLEQRKDLAFSISATSRKPRGEEQNGIDYYFLTSEEFQQKIAADELLEWEEVYAGTYYGTLNSELNRIWSDNKAVLFDVDVVGGVNIKKKLGEKALSIFVQPPSIEELEKRLRGRGTDDKESIRKRIQKAEKELSYKDQFDVVILNDDLEKAQQEVFKEINTFLNE